jgi:MraZ protein
MWIKVDVNGGEACFMSRFFGTSEHTIDTKGRIIIPARFRQALEELGSGGVVVAPMDKTLFVYSYDRWSEVSEKINSQAEKSDTMRRFRRLFVGNASDCPCDKQGRILVPPGQREYAMLERDITLVGVTDHFEVWNREKWKKENELLEEEDMKKEEVRNEIAKLGL